jgi:hypothetical protein
VKKEGISFKYRKINRRNPYSGKKGSLDQAIQPAFGRFPG